MDFRNAIFVVTEERQCPIYNVNELLKVENGTLTVPEAKPLCLVLVQEIIKQVSTQKTFEKFSPQGLKKMRFECGGCGSGRLWFEFQKEKEFTTLQMKLLVAAEKRKKSRHLDRYVTILRQLELFSPLTDDNLRDLSELLSIKEYAPGEVILHKGEPGTRLFIVLAGEIAVIDESGEILVTMAQGKVVGEMSLLSGEPVSKTVTSIQNTRLAVLKNKDFRHILRKYPDLNVLFYRLIVDRATKIDTSRLESIGTGMVGELSDINAVELFQMINASQKTGTVELTLEDAVATVLFVEGEIVAARYKHLRGKDALFVLLGKNSGRFSYNTGLSKEEERLPILGSFMGLVMEGMQRLDEEADDIGDDE